jgi:hypothetical protein
MWRQNYEKPACRATAFTHHPEPLAAQAINHLSLQKTLPVLSAYFHDRQILNKKRVIRLICK